MPKEGDAVLTNLTAEVLTSAQATAAKLEVLVHNLTDEEIAADALTVGFFATAQSGQTQSSAVESFTIEAVPANGMHTSFAPIQIDPGDWIVTASLFDSETNATIGNHDGIDVHIPGQVHEAQEFDDTVKHDVAVEIQNIERLGDIVYRVHYTLGNNGQTTVPAGMLVRAMIVENNDTLAWQDYHFEIPCPPGPPDPKYLTLEGSKQFTNATVFVTADPEGPSEISDQVEASVAADGSVTISR
jgi:hypothetical protein